MNIYFLVEGRQTEMKVYPKWLSMLLPTLTQVRHLGEVTKNNYIFFSGFGYPSMLDVHLPNCVADVAEAGKFDYLVVCLDADNDTVEERKQKVIDRVALLEMPLPARTKLEVIVQDVCFETWFLGNEKMFTSRPSHGFLKACVKHYNVKKQNPERMDKPFWFDASLSIFHAVYLQAMFEERGIRYSKSNPYAVMNEHYLAQLIKRVEKTNHLHSFQSFLRFCEQIEARMMH